MECLPSITTVKGGWVFFLADTAFPPFCAGFGYMPMILVDGFKASETQSLLKDGLMALIEIFLKVLFAVFEIVCRFAEWAFEKFQILRIARGREGSDAISIS